jgi:hypothetical protein
LLADPVLQYDRSNWHNPRQSSSVSPITNQSLKTAEPRHLLKGTGLRRFTVPDVGQN